MGTPFFNARQGLSSVLKGARYKGSFINHTEAEFNALTWKDIREKPEWLAVEKAALFNLRMDIIEDINEKTNYELVYGFRCTLYPNTAIHSSFEWQFDALNLYLHRDAGLFAYPYDLHVGTDDKAEPTFVTITDSSELQVLYLEMFGHINTWLATGRAEKVKLKPMTRTALEEYRDNR